MTGAFPVRVHGHVVRCVDHLRLMEHSHLKGELIQVVFRRALCFRSGGERNQVGDPRASAHDALQAAPKIRDVLQRYEGAALAA